MQGEFRGDFTRDTHHAFKHFSRVLMQQGRVHLDADWNEQTSILLRYLQTLAADLIGPHGGPVDPDGIGFSSFGIIPDSSLTNDFIIGAGHYYVHGILCQLGSTPVAILSIEGSSINIAEWCPDGYDFVEGQYVEVSASKPTGPGIPQPVIAKITGISAVGAPTLGAERTLALAPLGNASLNQFIPPTLPVLRRITTYKTQPDYSLPSTETGSPSGLVYLDVWERHITCIEDDAIREVALGGPDTATRAKIVWQVKVDPKFTACPGDPASWAVFLDKYQPRNRGWLKARAKQNAVSTDPCIILPESSYRGVENQLYRVEIHKGNGPTDSTFKWSRDNSSREFPIKSLLGSVATLGYLWRDSRSALQVNDWVEIVDDSSVLMGTPGVLRQVESVGDPSSMTVTLKPPLPGTPQYNEGDQSHPLLRRWNYKGGSAAAGQPTLGTDNALNLQEGTWLELEDGIQVYFVKASPDNRYRTGDYWIIPARIATGDVEWPPEKHADGTPVLDADGNPVTAALPPHGIEHHYAPLCILSVAGGVITATPDCRRSFKTVFGLTHP